MNTLLLALLLAGPAAAGAPASVEIHAPAGSVLIGAPVELDGVADYPDGFTLEAPVELSSGAVVVTAVQAGDVKSAAGRKEQALKLRVAAFELGAVTLPPMDWQLRGPDGAVEIVRSPAVRFESVGPAPAPGDKDDIRDIHGPLSAPWWLWLLPLALLALAIAGWWRWRASGGSGQGAPETMDTRLPHERALDELRALLQSELPVKEFYIGLTDILRRYFEARFRVDAAVLTTSDLLRQLRQAELDTPVLARCREVFDHADLAKFARWAAEADQTYRDWTAAESIVKETAPPPPQPPTDAAASGAGGTEKFSQ